MSTTESKLESIGIVLPEVPAPVAAYIPAVQAGNLVFTAGQIPRRAGKVMYPGAVGADVSIESAKSAAEVAVVQALAAIKQVTGSLDDIAAIVKMTVFVHSADGFFSQPAVADGASEVLLAAFGDAGKHARSAVGVKSLPLNASVEVELIAALYEV